MKTILVGFIFKSLFLFTEQLPETKELVILWADQFAQLDFLECHVCYTRLVENTDGFFIHQRQTGITPAFSFIKQDLILFGPCQSAVQACLDGNVISVFRCVRIREQQNIFLQAILICRDLDEAGHTDRFLQSRTVGWMFRPGLS